MVKKKTNGLEKNVVLYNNWRRLDVYDMGIAASGKLHFEFNFRIYNGNHFYLTSADRTDDDSNIHAACNSPCFLKIQTRWCRVLVHVLFFKLLKVNLQFFERN